MISMHSMMSGGECTQPDVIVMHPPKSFIPIWLHLLDFLVLNVKHQPWMRLSLVGQRKLTFSWDGKTWKWWKRKNLSQILHKRIDSLFNFYFFPSHSYDCLAWDRDLMVVIERKKNVIRLSDVSLNHDNIRLTWICLTLPMLLQCHKRKGGNKNSFLSFSSVTKSLFTTCTKPFSFPNIFSFPSIPYCDLNAW